MFAMRVLGGARWQQLDTERSQPRGQLDRRCAWTTSDDATLPASSCTARCLPLARSHDESSELGISFVCDEGAAALSEALGANNSTLKDPNLEGNSIDAAGAASLSEALRANATLGVLGLDATPHRRH
jgi:hypothetical protein